MKKELVIREINGEKVAKYLLTPEKGEVLQNKKGHKFISILTGRGLPLEIGLNEENLYEVVKL